MKEPEQTIKCENVHEYAEGEQVSLLLDEIEDFMTGKIIGKRWVIHAINEGGFNGTSVDLFEFLRWCHLNRPDLVIEAFRETGDDPAG